MTVVVGYVPSAEGLAALSAAAEQAIWRGASLLVVNVVVNGAYTDPTVADEQDLDAVAFRLIGTGLAQEVRQVEGSDVAGELIAAALHSAAQLIVVGLHRRSRVGKALLGSTAQQVILSAECPVLIVRA